MRTMNRKQFECMHVVLDYDDVVSVNHWNDNMGNPLYGVYMSDGSKYILDGADGYAFCINYTDVYQIHVNRKRDL